MSTQIKRLYQQGSAFVPITLAEAVVVNTSTIPGLTSLGITTLEKVLKNTLTVVASNTLSIDSLNDAVDSINTQLNNKQDKLTAGQGIDIATDGTISVIASTGAFEYKIVTSLPTASKECENIVYLLPNADGAEGNIFTEYLCINKDNTYIWEQIGSITTDINLDNYVTKTEFNQLKYTALTAEDVTTSAGKSVTVSYDIPSTLYDE